MDLKLVHIQSDVSCSAKVSSFCVHPIALGKRHGIENTGNESLATKTHTHVTSQQFGVTHLFFTSSSIFTTYSVCET